MRCGGATVHEALSVGSSRPEAPAIDAEEPVLPDRAGDLEHPCRT